MFVYRFVTQYWCDLTCNWSVLTIFVAWIFFHTNKHKFFVDSIQFKIGLLWTLLTWEFFCRNLHKFIDQLSTQILCSFSHIHKYEGWTFLLSYPRIKIWQKIIFKFRSQGNFVNITSIQLTQSIRAVHVFHNSIHFMSSNPQP
jgi:hypothetical protein